jgi:predicted DNA-binding ribbon-helix-helix protein
MMAYEKSLHSQETRNTGTKVAKDRKSDDESRRAGTYLVCRNIVVSGHRTSVRLEKEMWTALNDVAKREECTLYDLASRIDRRKKTGQSFTSAIRVFLMLYYRNAARRAQDAATGQGRQ